MAEERPPPEDSLRHLRCRGMTSQGFPLEIPIALLRKSGNDVKGLPLGGMGWGNNSWHNAKNNVAEYLFKHKKTAASLRAQPTSNQKTIFYKKSICKYL